MVTGFLQGGIEGLNKNRHPNFLVVEKDTTVSGREDPFRQFLNPDAIDIGLSNQYIAEMVQHMLDAHPCWVPSKSTCLVLPRTPPCTGRGPRSWPNTCAKGLPTALPPLPGSPSAPS